MENFFIKAVSQHRSSLTENDFEIVYLLDQNIQQIPRNNLKKLAEKVYTSPASLSRLVRKLGFKGFSEFNLRISDYLEQKEQNQIQISDYLDATIDEIKLTHQLNYRNVFAAAHLILDANERYAYATGWKQSQLLFNFVNDLILYDKKFYALRTKEDLADSVPYMAENSLVLLVSISGKIDDYRATLETLRLKKVKIISITYQQSSELVKYSEIPLFFITETLSHHQKYWSALSLSYLLNLLLQTIIDEK